jgi:P-type Cu2+ transporter
MTPAAASPALTQLGLADDDAVAAALTQPLAGGLSQVGLHVPDMRCGACAERIGAGLNGLRGVARVATDPVQRRVAIDYDPNAVTLAQLLGNIERNGYTPLFTLPNRDDPAARAERHAQLKRLGVAGIGMMQVMMFSIALYASAYSPMDPSYRELFRIIGLLFATPVVLYSAQPFFAGATQSLRGWRTSGRGVALSMDVPVALAIAAAYGASLFATVTGRGEVYFDSVTMFTFFLLGARYLEQAARHRLSRFDDWLSMFAESAMRHRDGSYESIPLAQIRAGDELLVSAGTRVPADATIIAGASNFDEAWLTGESTPVEKHIGANVYAGSINLQQPVTVRVDAAPAQTRMALLQRLADRAGLERPLALRSTDAVVRHFITAVLAIAAGTYVVWSWYRPEQAFATAIAVLVVSCPCALSLAAPTAYTAATTALRRIGFIVTRADLLDRLANATDVLFDKTGTLTGAGAQLVRTRIHGAADADSCVAIAAALERGANHPLAAAFVTSAGEPAIGHLTVQPGGGVEGICDGARYRLGSAAFCDVETRPDSHYSSIYLTRNDTLIATFELTTALRRDAATTIAALQQRGLNVEIVSGDAVTPTAAASRALSNVGYRAAVTPEQKLAYVRELQAHGRRVAMVGDGINDVPVLAAADASITPLEATDLAKHTSDAILLSRGLSPLVRAVDVARHTRTVIRQNLGWAILYNLGAVPLAATGHVAPWAAALGMSLSSLLVTLNALRLARDTARTPPGVAPTAQPAPV